MKPSCLNRLKPGDIVYFLSGWNLDPTIPFTFEKYSSYSPSVIMDSEGRGLHMNCYTIVKIVKRKVK